MNDQVLLLDDTGMATNDQPCPTGVKGGSNGRRAGISVILTHLFLPLLIR